MKFNNHCKHCGLPYYKCPNFIFGTAGFIIAVSIILIYEVSINNIEFKHAFIITSLLASLFLTITFVMIKTLEEFIKISALKSNLINIISHQIKSPLFNIQWVCDILMSGKIGELTKKQKEYINEIANNVLRLKNFTNNVIAASRIYTRDKFKLDFGNIRVVDLIGELKGDINNLLSKNNIGLKISCPEEAIVYSDRRFLKEALRNILENAVLYSNEGGNVIVKCRIEGRSAVFEISDNGIGIPEKDIKYIFEMFFRGRSAYKKNTEGTGLGLYISKSIINMLGGSIRVESKEGEGSTFYITIPLKNR